MAQRRMVSIKIIDSAKFLKMPISTQSLYFHLISRADDDGIVEAYNVLRMIGATEDDLRILVAKEFVVILNDDLVSYITDWKEHNKIRGDRKIDSIYKDLLLQIVPDVDLVKKKQRADVKKIGDGQLMDNQWTDNGQPTDGIGKVRLGKDRLGEVSIGKDNIQDTSKATKKVKHKYGEYKHVLLTDDEYTKLINDFGSSLALESITYLDEYVEMKGTKYKSHYLAIRKWVIDAVTKKSKGNSNNQASSIDNLKALWEECGDD